MSYVQHVFDRWKLAKYVQFDSTVKSATWNEDAKNWTMTVLHQPKGGKEETQIFTGRHLILATGCLSAPQMPKFPGFDDFKGEKYHTAFYPRDGVDFTGKRVAIIGTGAWLHCFSRRHQSSTDRSPRQARLASKPSLW